MVVLRCAIMLMVQSHRPCLRSSIAVMLCVVRVSLLMRDRSVLLGRTCMGAAGAFVIRAMVNAAHAAESGTREPKQRACSREKAEQGADSRLPRSFQLLSV